MSQDSLQKAVETALIDSLIRYEILKISHIKLEVAYEFKSKEAEQLRFETLARKLQTEALFRRLQEEIKQGGKAKRRTLLLSLPVGILIGAAVF